MIDINNTHIHHDSTLTVIFGAGGHGKSVADAFELQMPGCLDGFIDDDESLADTCVNGYPVLGNQEWFWRQVEQRQVRAVLGVGNAQVRRRFLQLCRSHGAEVLTVVHPSAVIAATATIEPAVVILARAIVNASARIGTGAIIGTGSIIEHDVQIEEFALIGPNVVTGGTVTIGAGATIGVSVLALPGVRVGDNAVVGAGSTICRDIPSDSVAIGIPARAIHSVAENWNSELPNVSAERRTRTDEEGRIYLSPPHLSGREQQYLLEAIQSNWVAPVGPHIDRFEDEFAQLVGLKHAVAVSSGTAAMHLAMRRLRLQPGEEVFCSTATFAASVNPVVYEGGTPVFIDSDPNTWNIDCNLLEVELKRCAAINNLPRAVIAVDLYGQCADWDTLRRLCDSFEVPLIEDAAEALGATYRERPAGSFGWANIFSFNGNKIITTSGGGMLATDDGALATEARFLATQARDATPHYEHSTIGFNYRMSNLLAGVGRAQLEVLADRVRARRSVFERYEQALKDEPGISFIPEAPYGQSNRWLTCILIDAERFGASREDVRRHLESCNIESRPVWKPMHRQPVFRQCRSVGGRVSEHLFETGLCLPSGSSLTKSEQDRVISELIAVPRKPPTFATVRTMSSKVSSSHPSKMQFEFLPPDSSHWKALLNEIPHDFYHRPEYVTVCANETNGAVARAFIAHDNDGTFLVPFLIREIETSYENRSYFDAATPYGYSSPLMKLNPGADPAAFMNRAVRSLITQMNERDLVAAFSRMHPLLPIPHEPLREFGTIVEHGETVYIDLNHSDEQISAETVKKTRQKIRDAIRDGYEAEVDPAWTAFHDFTEVYAQTMRRVGAAPEYFFSDEYFSGLRDSLRDSMHLVLVRRGGIVVTAAIFSEVNGIVQYHLAGRRDGYQDSQAQRLSLDFARKWFKARGNRFLHLGGGVGGRSDRVFQFKSHFSKGRSPFHTWRLVANPSVYRKLVEEWEKRAGISSEGMTGYFPEYRAPVMETVH